MEEIKIEEGKSGKGSWGMQRMSETSENPTARGQTSEFRLSSHGSTFSGSNTGDGRGFTDFDKSKSKSKDPWAKKRGTLSAQRKEMGGNRHRKTNSHGNLRNIQGHPDPKIGQSGNLKFSFIDLKLTKKGYYLAKKYP